MANLRSFSLYFSYSSTMKSYTNPFIWFVFWMITFFNASNRLSLSKISYCSAHYLFIKASKDWMKFVSIYFFNNSSIVIYFYVYPDLVLSFIGDYFCVEILFEVCSWSLWNILFFSSRFYETLDWVGNMLGRALEELRECILEFLLKLFSLLKYVVLTTLRIELLRSDIMTEEW